MSCFRSICKGDKTIAIFQQLMARAILGLLGILILTGDTRHAPVASLNQTDCLVIKNFASFHTKTNIVRPRAEMRKPDPNRTRCCMTKTTIYLLLSGRFIRWFPFLWISLAILVKILFTRQHLIIENDIHYIDVNFFDKTYQCICMFLRL